MKRSWMPWNESTGDVFGGLCTVWIGECYLDHLRAQAYLDRILCVKSGNPITIADEDIGVLLPSQLVRLFAVP